MNFGSVKSSDLSTQWMDSKATRQLLESSIVLAKRRAMVSAKRTVPSNRSSLTLTVWRWAYQLNDFYHLCYSTPQLMQEATKHFASDGHLLLAQWAKSKSVEEKNHHQLALDDLRALGFDADVVKIGCSPAAARLVNYFTHSVQAPDPINCVGYCFTMERLALGINESYLQKVQALLPLGTHATSCLRVHSSVGSDIKHVEKTVEMVSQLTFEEQNHVAKACYETALLYFSLPKERYVSEEELQSLLSPFKWAKDSSQPTDAQLLAY